MPLHFRVPASRRRAPALSRRPKPLAALVHGFLLVAFVLCALAHGPSDDSHHSSAAPAPVSTATPTAGGTVGATRAISPTWATPAAPEAPHGPHGHHSAEECLSGGVPRTPTAQTSHHPPPATDPAFLLAGITAAAPGPPRPARRSPLRRRCSRTGRTVLVRTSRWRI
ncbi:hypothetical protein E4N62_24325 [Streptomyces sp. MNU76]|uniref:hypothetical protein n=1 Tax=Streptomyces sp. MNU76 TaxID=2560026 RepID=UPI001E34BF43|nr:hypothetical protein [Streptomyces sp. MNU76]MCC9708110.1 hypothetical protein [Streptomyces sp. MNU76]